MPARILVLAVLMLAAAAPAVGAAPTIERIGRVNASEAVLSGDDRYVAFAAADGAVRVYDSRRRRTRTVRGTCPEVADVDGHRLLVGLRSAGCAPALVRLSDGSIGAPLRISPAVPSARCPLGVRSCPEGTHVEDYSTLAGRWMLGAAYTVGRLERENQAVVARRIDTSERRVLFAAPDGGGVAIEAADAGHAVLSVDERGAEEGEIFPDRRVAVALGSGEVTPLIGGEYLFSLHAGRALVSDNGAVRRLTLRRLPGTRARTARIRLRRAVRIHDAAAGGGAVAWMVQKRRPRRLAINLVRPGGRERLFVTHRPPRPRDDYLCARILLTRHALVWNVNPGYCNRTGPVGVYAVPRRQARASGRLIDRRLQR